ncbi:WD40-repeat-containing domain protein [Suillus fuscotomentosus]|uniref:WD40-repeat-containing domain protein n=1 Tax=Suillus fuscotomentosus TaxID=1912939 RepID=A0AAD4DYF8_9AGAM|nr:WD40-repeat-containing domain protein [Suillus fuscotomentosus]KAG1896421.1 WD40-repeat-containing domain protein [Suillus fuscotomentosus]
MSLAFVNALECKEPHSDEIWAVAWTANNTAVSASADGTVKQWDSTSGQVSMSRPPHNLAIVSLSVSPDGKFALYNGLDGTTWLWDLQADTVVGRHESYDRSTVQGAEPSWSVSLNPNGTTYAGTSSSGNVNIYSANPDSFGTRQAVLTSGRSRHGMDCVHSPDGTRVALSNEAGQVFIFDLESQALTSTYSSHAMCVRSLAWSSDGQLLLTASDDKRLILHDVRSTPSGKPGSGAVATLTGHSSWVLSTSISPDGRLAASGSADKTIKVWDLSARAAVSTLQESGEVWSIAWSPKPPASGTAGAFITGGQDGHVRWWRSAGTGA